MPTTHNRINTGAGAGLGAVTTAEGVKTQEQLEYIQETGVDLLQASCSAGLGSGILA